MIAYPDPEPFQRDTTSHKNWEQNGRVERWKKASVK